MWLTGGVKRTTFRGRFTELDNHVNDLLLARFASDSKLKVHDWAASDCIAAAAWAQRLFEKCPYAELTASDLTLYIVEISLPDGSFLLVEQTGDPLQYIRGPFVIRLNPAEPIGLLINRVLYEFAQRKMATVRKQIMGRIGELKTRDGLNIGSLRLQKISVIHPNAEYLRSQDRRFSIIRHSALEPLPEPVTAIRTMNLLSRAYFSPDHLSRAVNAAFLSLKPGGLWIVGRTRQEQPPIHDVSILEKGSNGFCLVERFGQGAEIESIALSVAGSVAAAPQN
jgi:hypothetical protein